MMQNYGVAKITDTQSGGNHILVSRSLESAASLAAAPTGLPGAIGPAGSVVGTATFSNGGMNPGSAGSILIADLDPNDVLRYEGQIALTVTTRDMAEFDNSAYISRSNGRDLAASQYLFQFRTAASVTHCSLINSAAQAIRAGTHSTDNTQSNISMTSVGKGDTSEVCVWWKGTDWGILIDGGVFYQGTRATSGAALFYKLYVGAGAAGTSSCMQDATIKNLVVTRRAPRLVSKPSLISIGLFGDSYVGNAVAAVQTSKYDNNCAGVFGRELAKYGTKVARIAKHGWGGYSVADSTGSTGNLSAKIAAFVAENVQVACIVAGNNDTITTIVSDAEFTNITTGTDASYKAFIAALAATSNIKKIIITTPGSLNQYPALDTAANRARNQSIAAIINALPYWWNAANPTRDGLVSVVDLHSILGGDADGNENYQGQYDTYGNSKPTAAVPAADRHPSSIGQILWLSAVVNAAMP